MDPQTGADSGRFQMAVASALSRKLGTNLLIVDDKLLAAVTRATLGQPPPPDETHRSSSSKAASSSGAAAAPEAASGPAGGVVPYVLSFFLCGGRLAFAWDALRQAWCVGVGGGAPLPSFRCLEKRERAAATKHHRTGLRLPGIPNPSALCVCVCVCVCVCAVCGSPGPSLCSFQTRRSSFAAPRFGLLLRQRITRCIVNN